MKKMIKIEIVNLSYVSDSVYMNDGISEILIDPNVIAELYPIRTVSISKTNYGYSKNDIVGTLEVATLYTTNVHGLGINGVNTRNYITKASYEKLISLFEII